SLGPLTLESEGHYLALCVVVLAVGIVALRRAFGVGPTRRAIQLLHHDESLLAAFGRDGFALKRSIFWVAALLAGIAGAIYAGADQRRDRRRRHLRAQLHRARPGPGRVPLRPARRDRHRRRPRLPRGGAADARRPRRARAPLAGRGAGAGGRRGAAGAGGGRP